MSDISAKYMIPKGLISCPDCGQVYGHHNTLVEVESELCKPCFIKRGFVDSPVYVKADIFIRDYLNI